jgi:hypothetical protein
MSNARARNAAAQRKYNPNPRPAAGLADFIKAGIQAQVNLNRKDAGLRPVKSAPRPIGNLPPSARVLSQYPPGVPTGVGGGNAAQSTDAPTFATTSPVDLSLSDYYTAQNVVGQGRFNQQNEEIDTVMNQLGYDEKMREWALANPMLAQREYARMNARQAGMEPVLINPDDEYTPAAEGSWIEYAVN